MIAKALNVARLTLPTLDEWLGALVRGTMALGAHMGSLVVPAPLDKFAHLVAWTLAIMTVWLLAGNCLNRFVGHAVAFIKNRTGLRNEA